MDLLADVFGLQFFALEEESSRHVVFVKDSKNETTAEIVLETGEVLGSTMHQRTLSKAKDELRYFRSDFLKYWDSKNRI